MFFFFHQTAPRIQLLRHRSRFRLPRLISIYLSIYTSINLSAYLPNLSAHLSVNQYISLSIFSSPLPPPTTCCLSSSGAYRETLRWDESEEGRILRKYPFLALDLMTPPPPPLGVKNVKMRKNSEKNQETP